MTLVEHLFQADISSRIFEPAIHDALDLLRPLAPSKFPTTTSEVASGIQNAFTSSHTSVFRIGTWRSLDSLDLQVRCSSSPLVQLSRSIVEPFHPLFHSGGCLSLSEQDLRLLQNLFSCLLANLRHHSCTCFLR
ncbi:hypothetical protein PoB_002944600 [Plakobranchus ocellatus]|uniref:Uncharacterized protein n=1 Tax=Plakobranchus ocellatus TaxID=259542 RepID=A0AAV4A8C2_9GAST|nr:hypothetical protein PoB_002944600 [Plakobranchus ocellatus]